MRLEEQAKILKEEIRRLERNQQREKEAANMEYLKNILLKVCSISHTINRYSGSLIFRLKFARHYLGKVVIIHINSLQMNMKWYLCAN